MNNLIKLSCCIPKCKNSIHNTHHFCKKHSKVYKFDKEDDCSVCLESLDDVEYPLLDCGHWIHLDCVFRSGKLECPICRTEIKMKHLTPQDLDRFHQIIEESEKKQIEERLQRQRQADIQIISQNVNCIFLEKMRCKFISPHIELFTAHPSDEEIIMEWLISEARKSLFKELSFIKKFNIEKQQSATLLIVNQARIETLLSVTPAAHGPENSIDQTIYNLLLHQLALVEYAIYEFCKVTLNAPY